LRKSKFAKNHLLKHVVKESLIPERKGVLPCEIVLSLFQAARLLDAVPELTEDLKTGALNLTQVSMMAHSLRQKKKEDPGAKFSSEDKQDLLNKIKNQGTRATERILAQELNLEIKAQDKQHIQSDESVRLEITFSKEEMEDFQRVKELISHIHPNPSWKEVMSYLGKDFVKRRDPRVKKPARTSTSKSEDATAKKSASKSPAGSEMESGMESEAKSETQSAAETQPTSPPKAGPSQNSRFISAEKRRKVFQRDDSCRWKCKHTGEPCGSKFQAEVDHIVPVWARGTNDLENLVLCSVHNQEKYRRESGRSKSGQTEFHWH
jgi:hypothetical protein